MFHYLYKTTCLINDTYYIGAHSTENLFDGYLGSGLRLAYSVAKYGEFNHDRVWLEFFDTREEAFAREAEVITQEFLDANQPQCMNLRLGGSGGWANEETQRKATKAANDRVAYLHQNDPAWRKWVAEQISIGHQNRPHGIKLNYSGWSEEAHINANSPKANAKRKATMAGNNHMQGPKNSQYGTCWVSNNVHTIKISIELLEEHISQGYVRGRKLIL